MTNVHYSIVLKVESPNESQYHKTKMKQSCLPLEPLGRPLSASTVTS